MLVTLFLVVLWNLSAWFFAERYYQSETDKLIVQESSLAQQRAGDLTDSVRRNLIYMQGIPDLLSELIRVRQAALRFGDQAKPSVLPMADLHRLWTEDPELKDLSRYLALAQNSLNADLIFVVNAAGDCVASSNWDSSQDTIGSNHAAREFFKSNQNMQRGMQYSAGKTTHISGIFFSSPIIIDGKFMGAVVAKTDMSKLSFLLALSDTFITDSNGVVILATDKKLEMHALPDSGISRLPMQDRTERYRMSSFPVLKIMPWKDNRFPALLQFQERPDPQVMATTPLPEYELQLHVNKSISSLPALRRQSLWFSVLIGALGSVLILIAGGLVFYLQSLRLSRALLWKKANFDALTDLPNRDMFRDRLMQEIKKSDRTKLSLALFFIDLDRFKEVNDTLGHDMGDILLQEAALRLASCVRKSDTVARLGGDEFTVVLSQLADARHSEDIAQKIIAKLAKPFHLKNEIIYISASIGITLYPLDASNIDNMMKNADQAMYVAKAQGRNRFSYFTASLQEAAHKKLRLTNDLHAALTEHQFRVYFQPIIELKTNRLHKAEALLRWLHPVRGMISPLEFIPLAEETRLIIDIGTWVRKESMVWCRRWKELASDEFQISVNKSPVEFMDESNSVESFINDLQGLGLCGKNIAFEITEGMLLNSDSRINNKLMALRDAGIQISIDDFGTGYSSLSYLKKFDIDYLKIDHSFIGNLEPDSDDMALCEAIIVMAHKLGLKVIAEGVETEQQRDLLAHAGCDYAQGYLYAKAIPPEEFETYLQSHIG